MRSKWIAVLCRQMVANDQRWFEPNRVARVVALKCVIGFFVGVLEENRISAGLEVYVADLMAAEQLGYAET